MTTTNLQATLLPRLPNPLTRFPSKLYKPLSVSTYTTFNTLALSAISYFRTIHHWAIFVHLFLLSDSSCVQLLVSRSVQANPFEKPSCGHYVLHKFFTLRRYDWNGDLDIISTPFSNCIHIWCIIFWAVNISWICQFQTFVVYCLIYSLSEYYINQNVQLQELSLLATFVFYYWSWDKISLNLIL